MPILVEVASTFSHRGELVHVVEEVTGQRYALPIDVARATWRALGEAIAEYDARPDNVVPLCELCVRYDLPKHRD